MDLLLAAAANGRERRQDSTQGANCRVALRARHDSDPVLDGWEKPECHELNIKQRGSATKKIAASSENASVALAWTSELRLKALR